MGHVPKEKKFILKSGRALASVHDLRESLQKMDDEDFRHHVNSERNDFSLWARDVMKEEALAARLSGAKTKKAALRIVEKWLQQGSHKLYDIDKLNQMATKIRRDIIGMLITAGSGHSAGSLGSADIFTALYFNVMQHNPRDPKWTERDRFVLSCGHICPALYATLANVGYFRASELKTLRKLGTRLQGHPHNLSLPGIETSSGPLGQGLSQAAGMAIAAKLDSKRYRVYCLMSDGEQDEGQIWEAAMLASKYRLSNLTALIDRNNIQIDGHTEDVMPLEPLRAKYEAFNWHVIEVDGHNIERIIDALHEAEAIYEKPTVIIAHTIPGKGIDFMEFDYKWHGKPPNEEEAEAALEELRKLRSLGGRIVGEHE